MAIRRWGTKQVSGASNIPARLGFVGTDFGPLGWVAIGNTQAFHSLPDVGEGEVNDFVPEGGSHRVRHAETNSKGVVLMIYETLRRALVGSCALMIAATLATCPAAAQPTTTKSTTKTGATTTTKAMEGTVLAVDGNNLVVRMSTGEIRHIVASSSQRALIDGKEVAAKDLKVGTKLKATVTTTTTSVVDRTVTVGSGKVWYVAAPNVILTLPNGENRQYKASDDYKFIVDGRPATVFELRKGMTVSAEKIVEEPRTVVTANTVVTGELPPPVQTASSPVPSAAPGPKPAPEPVRPTEAAPAPTRAAEPAPAPATEPAPSAAPAPAAAAAPAAAPAPATEPASTPAQPTQTGSTLLWIGLVVVLLIACYFGFRAMRRGQVVGALASRGRLTRPPPLPRGAIVWSIHQDCRNAPKPPVHSTERNAMFDPHIVVAVRSLVRRRLFLILPGALLIPGALAQQAPANPIPSGCHNLRFEAR